MVTYRITIFDGSEHLRKALPVVSWKLETRSDTQKTRAQVGIKVRELLKSTRPVNSEHAYAYVTLDGPPYGKTELLSARGRVTSWLTVENRFERARTGEWHLSTGEIIQA
jgi:hypothetical protein